MLTGRDRDRAVSFGSPTPPASTAHRIWKVAARASPPYLLMLPSIAMVAAVSMIPLGFAGYQSLHRSHYFEVGSFSGLTNYFAVLFSEAGIRTVVNSIVFVVGSTAITMALGISLALLLNRSFPLRGFFRTILLAPWLVSALSAGLLWAWLLNAHFGPVAQLVSNTGFTMPNVLTNPSFAMPALCVVNAWSSYPLVMVLVLAALQTIPDELLDAARVDGASFLQRLRHVMFPLIRRQIAVAMIMTTLHTFNNATLVLVMTGGGPVGTTNTMALRVFREGLAYFNMGTASAGAIAVLLLNVIFAVCFIRAGRKSEVQ